MTLPHFYFRPDYGLGYQGWVFGLNWGRYVIHIELLRDDV